MRKWIIPLAVLMVVPALGAAAPIVQPPEPETLVEGHTVFTVIEQINRNVQDRVEYGAAVAVLVREATINAGSFRFPGVLWFNDQYLVNPYYDDGGGADYRFPCTGAVLATNRGAGDPLAAFTAGTPVYNESYQITDPNDHSWWVDKWIDPTVGPIWVVAIMNNQAGINTADDGSTSCSPVDEGELNLPACPTGSGTLGAQPLRCEDDSYATSNGNAVSYNALLYFVLADLTVANTTKDHRTGSADLANDVSGCHDSDPAFAGDGGSDPRTHPWNDSNGDGQYDVTPTSPTTGIYPMGTGVDNSASGENRGDWPCPNGDDSREGNSHTYNPYDAGLVCPKCTNVGGHGGSGGGADLHATRDVDIFYGTAPAPIRTNVVLTDREGSTAPFHCHGTGGQIGGCGSLGPSYPWAGSDSYNGRGY